MDDTKGSGKRDADERTEFLSAYSDDLIYLDQALDALLLHPRVGIVPQLAVASIARQTAVAVSNAIDMTLNRTGFGGVSPLAREGRMGHAIQV
jgi:hypothetical protein